MPYLVHLPNTEEINRAEPNNDGHPALKFKTENDERPDQKLG
jgi:hypothetical protein